MTLAGRVVPLSLRYDLTCPPRVRDFLWALWSVPGAAGWVISQPVPTTFAVTQMNPHSFAIDDMNLRHEAAKIIAHYDLLMANRADGVLCLCPTY